MSPPRRRFTSYGAMANIPSPSEETDALWHTPAVVAISRATAHNKQIVILTAALERRFAQYWFIHRRVYICHFHDGYRLLPMPR